MIIPKEPWTTRTNLDGSGCVRDALGNVIAVCQDWQVAEAIAGRNSDKITELEERIENLEEDLEAERESYAELEKELKDATKD